MLRHYFLCALLLLVVGGCVYNLAPEKMFYPSTWPQLRVVNPSTCKDFVGVYSATGENAQRSPNSVNSPKLLNLLAVPSSRDTVYVSVQSAHEGEAFHVVALNAARELIPGAGTIKPISCRNGNLVRNFKVGGSADGSSHKSETAVTLSLALDGSLVAHVVGSSHTDDFLSHATFNYDALYRFLPSK